MLLGAALLSRGNGFGGWVAVTLVVVMVVVVVTVVVAPLDSSAGLDEACRTR
jgi:hypothetical protein